MADFVDRDHEGRELMCSKPQFRILVSFSQIRGVVEIAGYLVGSLRVSIDAETEIPIGWR